MQRHHLKPKLAKSKVDEKLQSAQRPIVQMLSGDGVRGGADEGLRQPIPKPVESLVPAHCHLQSHEDQDSQLALPNTANTSQRC